MQKAHKISKPTNRKQNKIKSEQNTTFSRKMTLLASGLMILVVATGLILFRGESVSNIIFTP